MAYKTYETILVEEMAPGVRLVTLNRPEQRNSLSPRVHEEMTEVLEELRYDHQCRVVVLTGSGKAFSAGMDLKEFFTELKDEPNEFDRVARLSTEWRGRTLRYFPKATIAMVNGYCFGGAFSAVEACDLAFAADEATFGLSEINFKLFPGGPVSASLAKLFRPRDALYYGLTGETFTGQEAEGLGFVNKSVPLAQLRDHVLGVAEKIAAMDPAAVRATKDAYRYSLEMSWDAGVSYAFAKQGELSFVQQDSWRSDGIGDFLDGKYRPGLEARPRQAP